MPLGPLGHHVLVDLHDCDRAALDGAKALAMTALDFFCDAELRERTRRAFDDSSERRD